MKAFEDTIDRLRAENARLAAFAREIIGYAFDGRDADGASIQALAVHYGLLIETKYDPKRHGPSFADPGADWCEFAGPLARPAAAEGADPVEEIARRQQALGLTD